MLNNFLILLSTFNGDKYIKDLLESLIGQENVKCKILVRDDGSSDKTLEILQSYSNVLNLELHIGENVGANESFKLLMRIAADRDFDYIAFCDQDDIWEPTKLKRASQQLENSEKSLYASRRKLVDHKGKYLRMYPSRTVSISYENSIIENVCAGCTMVLKHDYFKEIMGLGLPQISGSYDHAIYNMSSVLNEGFFDQESRILYRIHSGNAIGIRNKFKLNFIKLQPELLIKIRTSVEVKEIMDSKMSYQQKLTLDSIVVYSKFFKRMSRIFKLPCLRQNKAEDLFLKVYLLLNQKQMINQL